MKNRPFRFPYFLTDLLLGCAFSWFILWTGTQGFEAIQSAKYDLFLLLFGGYLALMTLFTVELMAVRKMRPPKAQTLWKKASAVQKTVVLFWMFSVVSTALSPHISKALLGMSRGEGLLTITIYCGCFLCVSVYGRWKRWHSWLLGGTMTVYVIICLLQLNGGNPLGLYPDGVNYFDANVAYSGIYLGTTGNADLTAALLCLIIPLLWIMILRGKEKWRWLLLMPAVLCVLVLRKLDVQAGLVGIAVGTLFSIPVVLPVQKKWKKVLAVGVALLIVFGLWSVWTTDHVWGTVYEFSQLMHGNWDDHFGNGRIYIWRQVLEQIPENLWFGTGPDTMGAAEIRGFSRYNSVLGVELPYIVDTAHNEYLNILFHQGIFALLAYVGALFVSAYRWIKYSGKSGFAAACGGAVLCYCVQAFFGFSMCASAGLFWLVWALLERETNKIIRREKHE